MRDVENDRTGQLEGSSSQPSMSSGLSAGAGNGTGNRQRTQGQESGQEGTDCFRTLYPKRRNSQNGRIFLPQGAILSERSEFIVPCGAQEYPDILRNFPLRISRPETACPFLPALLPLRPLTGFPFRSRRPPTDLMTLRAEPLRKEQAFFGKFDLREGFWYNQRDNVQKDLFWQPAVAPGRPFSRRQLAWTIANKA